MAKIKRRKLKITGIILLVVVAIVFSFNTIVAKLIERKLNDFLLKENLKHYHIQYKRAGFNILNRSVSLTGLSYLPDSAYLDSLSNADIATMVPSFTVRRISVSGIDYKSLIDSGMLRIKKITIKKPVIKLYQFTGKSVSPPAGKKKPAVHDSIRMVKLSGLFIYTISLRKCSFEIYNYKLKKNTLSSNNITVQLDGLQLKPGKHHNSYFYPVLQDATLSAKNNKINPGNQLYEIDFKKLFVNLKDDSLMFDDFHYRPLYSKTAFSRHIRFQKERFDLQAKKITFSGADFYLFLTRGELFIKKIGIFDAAIDLYRDKKVPFNHRQRPLLPHQTIKRQKGKFDIDTVVLHHIRFAYSEKTAKRQAPLHIFFTGLSGQMTHISNLPYLWRQSPMQVTLQGKFMDRAPLKIRFVFPLAAQSDTFYFNGSINGPVPFTIFDPAIYPAAGLKFTGGILNKITFKGGANPRYASGTMQMLYKNMNFQALKKDEQTVNKFVSWGINSFVRKNNLQKGKGKSAKQAVMFFQRDVEKGFGNFFWKTLYSGMKATMLPSINTINRKNLQSVIGKSDTKKPVKKK
jgi:hypothetical protein